MTAAPLELAVHTLGGLGDGVATHAGKPVFVGKSCAGDRVEAVITHQTADHTRAKILRVLEAGPDRALPPCPHYDACGSCALQHLTEDAYRGFKQRALDAALGYAGIDTPATLHFVGPGTRRRAEFNVMTSNGPPSLAFFAPRSHDATPIDHCLVVEPGMASLIPRLNAVLRVFPEAAALRTIALTAADSGMDMLIGLYGADDGPARRFAPLLAGLPLSRIAVRLAGHALHIIEQREPVTMRLGGYDIAFAPDAFLQATREGQRLLGELAAHAVAGADTVVDLFCGIGTYSFEASRSARVLALENDAAMVQSLTAAARRHGVSGLKAQKRDLFKNPVSASELKSFGAAILNPPRNGAPAQTKELAEARLPRVAMISCNPATFSRDARVLLGAGYRVRELHAIDQFVWSPHLEIAAIFTR